METTSGFAGREQEIYVLFTATFTSFEGEDEGKLIGGLVRNLFSETPAGDIRVFCAEDESQVIAAVVFTRLKYPEDPRQVVLLSPLAVATARQRQGVGQALLEHALEALRSGGVEIVITYGYPRFYGKVEFRPITEEQARPPLPLSMPHGWLGQSRSGPPMPKLYGSSTCVSALSRADIW